MVIRPSTVFSYTWLFIFFIPVLLLPQFGNSSKTKQAFKVNLITYTHGFASGVPLLPYSPQFSLHYETLFPTRQMSCGWNLLPFNVTPEIDD